ncbi:MAG: HAMP domain-containing protein, partial [Thermodesulfovibrionia bacterium]|nr:HAMP domain-containing protein [Thermodesulfovibrionia bacterium]
MPILRNMVIKHKLIIIIMLTCISALIIAGTVFIVWESYTLHGSVIRNLAIQAKIVAYNCKTALVSDDAKDAKEALSALHVEPSIIFACVRDKDGKVFTSYNRDAADKSLHLLQINEKGYGFSNTSLNVREEVILDGQAIGSVYIASDLNPMNITLKRNASIIIAVLVLASLVAYFISSRLQRIISEPILSLTKVVKVISEKKDYTTRVAKHSNDEIGFLVDAFNEMFEQTQQRDSALVKSKEELEIKVKE